MRRHEESQHSEFEKAVNLGKDNADCLRRMSHWCKHAEIKLEAAGLYAEMTRLPIATYSISCPYVQGGSQAMNLRWLFSDFLVENCAGCQYQAPNGDASWGQAIIDNHRQNVKERDQAAKEESDRVLKLRSDLRSISRTIGSDVDPESQRILDFLEDVFSEVEAERNEASARLMQAARLGPELFPDPAIDLLLILAGSKEFAETLLPVCAELASKRPELGSRFERTAIANIENGLYPELSASLLVRLGDAVVYPLGKASIERLLLSQNHGRPIGGWANGEPEYSNSNATIVRSFDADPESVQIVIRRVLKNENDIARFQLCGALKSVQAERPQIVINLLLDLVQSLEIYEDAGMSCHSPSGQIVHILSSAFQHSTELLDHILADAMARVRPTVQADIIRIYRDQFLARNISWEERREVRQLRDIPDSEKAAVHRLFEWAKDHQLQIDIRVDALEALEIACKYTTKVVLQQFDSLLGYTAIVNGQQLPPDAPPKIVLPGQVEDAQLARLNEMNRVQQWGFFKLRLQKCLEALCEAEPSVAFDSVDRCLSQPFLEDGFKACCISLLGEVGKDYVIRPRALPLIMRALMDYSSAWARANAIRATVEMFSYSNGSPPANLVDTIIVHLQDPKVIVHQAALHAVSWRPGWFDDRQSMEVLNCLASHLNAYHNNKYQLDNICDGILAIGRRNERLGLLALGMVQSIFPTGEEVVDAKIAEYLIRFCGPEQPLSQYVARDIGLFLGRHDRDRLNYYGHSDRGRMFEWLHELPVATYQNAAKELLKSAKEMAIRDGWESCQFASVFAHFRDFTNEHSVLNAAVNALPCEPRHEPFRVCLQQLAAVAAGNASLQEGAVAAAEASFAENWSEA